MACQEDFDHVVINREGGLDEAVSQILAIIEDERGREGRLPTRV